MNKAPEKSATPSAPTQTPPRTPSAPPRRRHVPKNRSQPRPRPRTPSLSFVGWRVTKFDMPLFLITLVLCVFGLGMLLSSSWAFAAREHDDSYFFFNNQLVFMAVGIGGMLVISFVKYQVLMSKLVLIGLGGGALALMLAVQVSGAGVEQGGAERWLEIGGVTFQPSEILKFALIVVLAWFAHRNPERIKGLAKENPLIIGLGGAFRFAGIIGVACVLTVIQPHLSGTVIMFLIGLTLMVISGCRLRWPALMCIAVVAVIPFVPQIMEAAGYSYSDARMLSWRDPFADVQGDTFQTFQSLVAIGSGGWFGLGLGNSRQKFSYLPAAHNDFIYSVIVEELGFVGGILVLLLFVVFIMRGFYIASRAPDRFGTMLAAGITVQIGIQAFLNIAVATNTVPNTGVSLPFFSYGGTALIMQLWQIGVLLNISRKARM